MQETTLSIAETSTRGRDQMSQVLEFIQKPRNKKTVPRRLKVFLDFLDLHCGSLDEQALRFLERVTQDHRWFEDRFMDFINFQIERVSRGESLSPPYPTITKQQSCFWK